MTLDSNAKINITSAASVVAAVLSGTIWMMSQFSSIREDVSKSLMETRTSIEDLKKQVADATTDRYTKTQAAEVALRNAIRNPGMSFADPRDPNVAIVVDSGKISRAPADR